MNAPAVSLVRSTSAGPLSPIEEQIADFEKRTGLRVSEKQRARLVQAQLYKAGDLQALHESGAIELAPDGPRLLLRAILQEDASVLTLADELGGHAIEYDARKCIAHEVVAVGTGVRAHLDSKGVPDDTREVRSASRKARAWFSGRGAREGARPQVGDHVFVLSTVADRASKTSRAVRLWAVHVDDVSLRWRPTTA